MEKDSEYFMYKNSYTFSFLIFCFSYLLMYPNIALANNTVMSDSVITLPIEADLQILEKHINSLVPQLLSKIDEPHKVCVKTKYLKTKGIPKCRRDGHKISCEDRWIKVKTLPKINCSLKGWVKRDGPILLSGEGKTLTFAFPLKAQLTTKAGIQETAHASATLYFHATVNINKDWSISVDLKPHFVWSEQPNLRILNIISVNIKNNVEPKLRKKLKAFVKKVPKLLENLEMKKKLHTVWQDIQEPLKLHNNSETYLYFKPKSASYSGFRIVNNKLKTTLSLKGSTAILLGKPNLNYKKTSLCDLEIIPQQDGVFNFNIPVSIPYQDLLNLSNKKFQKGYTLDMPQNSLPGVLKISNPKIEKSQDGDIRISAHIHYDHRSSWLKSIDIFDWFDVKGEVTFKGRPKIDKQKRYLVLDNLVYDSSTNSDLFDILVDTADLQSIKSHFSDLIKYEFGQKIDDGIVKANKALKKFSKGNLNIDASLQIASIEHIKLHEEHITIHTKLSGIVNADLKF